MRKAIKIFAVAFVMLTALVFTVSAEEIADGAVKIAYDTVAYTGKAICPDVTVDGLTENKDYTVTYANNTDVGRATVMIDDVNDEGETVYRYFDIVPRHIKKTEIKLSYSTTHYNSKKKKPSVTVKYNGRKLEEGKDYTVTYENNRSTGKATVVIKGKGNFRGSTKKYFYIAPEKVKKAKAVKITSNSVRLSWKKAEGATEYRIYKYAQGEWKYVSTVKGLKCTVKKLKSDTEYKFKVRAVAKADNKKLYGEYSRTVAVRTELKGSDKVYISSKGRKCHRKGCSYVSKSAQKVTYSYAKSKNYGKCSVCFK